MALESILIGENMGIFSKIHKKSKGIAAATAIAAATVGADAKAQNYDNLPVEMNPEIQEQLKEQRIPEYLAQTMFSRIPNAQRIIRNFNYEGNFRNPGNTFDKVSYVMNPKENHVYVPRGTWNGLAELQLGMDSVQLPEYWVLFKLGHSTLDQSTYNNDFEELKDDIKDPGVYHLAASLKTYRNPIKQRREAEQHLLKALYYAFHGNDNGATPLLNGSFVNMPEVQKKVQEWEEKDYRPLDPYHNSMLAYFSETLLDQKPKNEVLAGLSMMLLFDYYGELNENRATAYHLLYNSFKDMPNFRIDLEKGYKIPFEVFE